MTDFGPPSPRASASLAREDGREIFGDGAAGYHAIRLGYPDELYDHLAARAGRLSAVLEIGPGSGLVTEALLEHTSGRYVCVESDHAFVDFLRRRWPGGRPELVCAPFPCEGLDGPFNLVACAAAFHWLEPVAALAAIRNLLNPDGIWAMWWNSYLDQTNDHPFALAAMDLLREHGARLPPSFDGAGHLSLDTARQIALLSDNGFVDVEVTSWRRSRLLDAEQAAELFESFSFVRLLSNDVRARLIAALRELIESRFGGAAENRVSTTCYSARPVQARA
jgi:SAM-dependent methyltransferase